MKRIVWSLMALTLMGGCAAQPQGNDNRVAITVTDKGFEPEVVTVSSGKPVTLVVTRTTAETCATELVMPSKGINQTLPLGQTMEITFTPTEPGEYAYACAMDMYKGKVIAR